MITISLCMIVKNEERVLKRCLDSVAGLMDEIVIVDTGSTDRTKEIAAEYTDKIYDFVWTGRFCDARNFSFSKAACQYIYCADADEVLDEENQKLFLLLKENLLPEIDLVQMYYKNQLAFNTVYNYDRELRPKLFKRLREFVWEYPIHETVRLQPMIFDSDIEILHLPENLHTSRDVEAFERMIDRGEVLDKRLHNFYARELFVSGSQEDFAKAKGTFLTSAADADRSVDELKEATCVLARAFRLENDMGTFFKFAMKNVAMDGCAEICCELGEYYRLAGDFEEAIVWFFNAAFETECILDARCGGTIPLLGLAECYGQLGNREEELKYRRMGEEWGTG